MAADQRCRIVVVIVEDGGSLAVTLADTAAEAMASWTVEKNMSHFIRWVLRAIAEKHDDSSRCPMKYGDSLIVLAENGSKANLNASSFLSGGF